MQLRAARLGDVEAVTDYYLRAWQSNLAHLFSPGALDAIPDAVGIERREIFTAWFEERDGHRSLVAVGSDDRPLGHVTVLADELLHLFIDPDGQGGGIGSRLLAAGEDLIARAGHGRARLMTLVGNDAAVTFYERHGWSVTGRRIDEVYFGEAQIEQELAKEL